jgi:hypothetical protein
MMPRDGTSDVVAMAESRGYRRRHSCSTTMAAAMAHHEI